MLQCELAKIAGASVRHSVSQAVRPCGHQSRQAVLAQSKVYPDADTALKGLTFEGMTVMIELAPDVTPEEVTAKTEAKFASAL